MDIKTEKLWNQSFEPFKSLNAEQYSVLMGVIANELSICRVDNRDPSAIENLEIIFVKMDVSCPYPDDEMTHGNLVHRFRGSLAHLYPV
ncbi:hypothetical protein ACI2KR_27105 [Pseudomonas luteola]